MNASMHVSGVLFFNFYLIFENESDNLKKNICITIVCSICSMNTGKALLLNETVLIRFCFC